MDESVCNENALYKSNQASYQSMIVNLKLCLTWHNDLLCGGICCMFAFSCKHERSHLYSVKSETVFFASSYKSVQMFRHVISALLSLS